MQKRIIIPKGRVHSHLCSHCRGAGRVMCPRCSGTGTMSDRSRCYYCNGERMTSCNACNGTGRVDD